MLTLVILATVISLLAMRPPNPADWLRNLIYFQSFYLWGIVFCRYYERIHRYRKHLLAWSALGFVTTLSLQMYYYRGHFNFHKDDLWSYAGVDLMGLQKLFLSVFMIIVLRGVELGKVGTGLRWLATMSFGIYFLHDPARDILLRWPPLKLNMGGGFWPIGQTVVIALLSIAVSSVLVGCVRKFFGPVWSRRLVGG